jgi:nucleotide-binding universal stress UspA family protein
MTEVPARRRIVVGVDGSLPSLFGLRWAGREAWLRDAELHAVIVDTEADAPRAPYAPSPPAAHRAERWAAATRTLVDSIRTALGPCPDVPVHEHIEEGRAPQVLARHAEGAELLVLGSRRRSGPGGPTLGATVCALLRVAGCPVAVIHTDDSLSLDLDARSEGWQRVGAAAAY